MTSNNQILSILETLTKQKTDEQTIRINRGQIAILNIDYFNSIMNSLNIKELYHNLKFQKMGSIEPIDGRHFDIHIIGNELIEKFLDKYSSNYEIKQ